MYFLQQKLYKSMWSKGLDVDIRFADKQLVKGDKGTLVETITNNKWLPLSMVRIKFMVSRNLKFTDMDENTSVSDLCYKNDVFSLLFYQKITRTLEFQCKRRGYYSIDKVDMVSTNLFLTDNYIKTVDVHDSIVVYPLPADSNRLEIPFSKIMGECLTRKYLYEDPFEFRGIRQYEPYDSMRSINWKASAKTGELRVNVNDYTASQEICILLNLESEVLWESEGLKEECISIAVGLAERIVKAGINVRFVTNGCDIFTKTAPQIEAGASNYHISSICGMLARIDLKLPMQRFVEIVEKEEARKQENCLYVMISIARSETLQKAYNKLCAENKGSMWIIPFYKQPEFDIEFAPNAEIIPWEAVANEE